MSLAIGTRLGPYEILSALGAGGMGEVYRARDTNLKRQVAIKVLPTAMADDPERLARFQREAEVLAALNHPNIAHIHGLEKADGTFALVMELVEGPTLADRIAQGPIPVAEALPIARQIAEALEAAHEQGIIHRDLKPANIKVRDDGTVKVLDFGLAKLIDPTGAIQNGPAALATASPTITTPAMMTGVGVILGTAAYMSPEQARGRTVDKRTDLWAFGCVLFEMLTGKRTFGGDDMADVIAAVVRAEPDWNALPATTPAAIRRLLRRALAKDARNRLSDASIARLEIDEALTMPQGEAAGVPVTGERPRSRERVAWAVVAALLLAVAALWVPATRYLRGPAPGEPVRFQIETPTMPDASSVSISPDGRKIAFVASAEGGKTMLFVRPVDSVTARPLVGTESALSPFWSPDSRYIVFSAPNRSLKKVEATGGPPQMLCTPCYSGTWNRDGVIVFGSGFGNNVGLSRVSAAGGMPTPLTTPDQALQEVGHNWPYFLPDGRHFLYLAWSTKPENRAIYVGALDSDQKTRIMTSESMAAYVPQGSLIFQRQGTLFAQLFDATRLALRGEPIPVAEGIPFNAITGRAAFAVSSTGTLIYRSGAATATRQLAWFDREGLQLATIGQPGPYGTFALSPDEKWVAFQRTEPGASTAAIWTLEISNGILSRLTTNPANVNELAWSPDSRTVVFASNRKGNYEVFQRTLGSQDDVRVFESTDGNKWPDDWSRDGQFILINDGNQGIVALPTAGDRRPIHLFQSRALVDEAHLSPDGRWLAYASTESGQAEIYVASFPEFKHIKQVSAGGGNEPKWRRDGKELFYMTSDGEVFAVGVNVVGPTLETTAPKMLFATRVTTGTAGIDKYAVSADGKRFLVLNPVEGRSTPITVVLNWQAALEARERR